MPRLVIVSNRLPVTIDKKDGELFYHPSAGGLATGLHSLDQSIDKVWIGWPGKEIVDPWEQEAIRGKLEKDQLIPVFLSDEEIQNYYEGFSNKSIWPHFHYFTQYTAYEDHYWVAYCKVNRKFAEVVINHLLEGDILWVHDYQLMLLPGMVREAHPKMSIGFFLHIPFPSYELFRILPWRQEILEGIIGADQIGFHTFDYMRHFLSAVYRIGGYEHNFGKLTVQNRAVNVDVFPMGIDYEKYAHPEKVADTTESSRLIQRLLAKKRRLIISIDRLDYTKGIPQRLRAYEQFISRHPHYKGKVTLMLIVVPSRSNVDQYQELKDEVDTLVGRIDGEYRTFGWSPIQYFYRSFSFAELTALYEVADIAMITPLRDGMNLVAKEYVASKEKSKKGVLILSEMAGAANELSDALLVNPQDLNDMVQAIVKALEMPLDEQKERLEKMQLRLKKYTVRHWAESFLEQQIKIDKLKGITATNMFNETIQTQLLNDYQTAQRRLILLDYDGTLMPFFPNPHEAEPDAPLLKLLEQLKSVENNKIVIVSGRDRKTLGAWLGYLGLEMAAEHGVWSFNKGKWQASPGLSAEWKADVRPVLEDLVERTPGSFIEEKDFSIAWHYRNIDRDLGEKRVREFRDVLRYLTANLDLQVLEGNKVVEIKNAGVNKGKATSAWLNEADWDFILAIGDDHTDEDTFKVLPQNAYSIKVGLGPTAAKYNTVGVDNVRSLLQALLSR
ncbi:MAG: bifunctional alpha,alpha-trehalose-phosphate synthase (UDP-forming)/trehalose-phosphatase [Bacteroidota bacterium]